MLDGGSIPATTPRASGAGAEAASIARPARRDSILRETKAETLDALRACTRDLVPDLVHFAARTWPRCRTAILRHVLASLRGAHLAVRSSARDEDRAGASRAGHYRTVLDVPRDPTALARAIDAVVASFDRSPGHRVLVQDMAHDVVACGVLFTRDPAGGGPYHVFEYDACGSADAVTSGATLPERVVVHRARPPRGVLEPRLGRLLRLARRIERLAGHRALDIEIAEARDGRLAVLQVRALAVAAQPARALDRRVARILAGIERELAVRARPRPGVVGSDTVLGQMPDWNPAELIGTFPGPLAASLFACLIGDDVWQRARATMGYRPVPGGRLVTILGGRPWVDVRASFSSFLPAAVDEETGTALVDAWLARLRAQPELHDAVELEIAQTVRDFTFTATHAARYRDVLARRALARYTSALAALSARCVRLDRDASLPRALAAVERLANGPRVRTSHDTTITAACDLLERCRAHGTLPFAIVARHAFIAEALLRSAVERGALAPRRLAALRASLTTVASRVAQDLASVGRGALSREIFLARFGHLRPGTFEVTSRRYDARPELFDDAHVAPGTDDPRIDPFLLTAGESRALSALCREHALHVDGTELVAYAMRAIAGREHAKLLFTRELSAALESCAAWGARHGLARADVSDLTLAELRAAGDTPDAAAVARLRRSIARRRARRTAERAVRLGPLLRDARDLYLVPEEPRRPTFVTTRVVAGRPLLLDGASDTTRTLAGRVVCISSADPGYDWIFASRIAGLVTRFGGSNSHMAIRCHEHRLPAAIGVGETLFERICGASLVELRCHDRLVRCLDRDASV